jgi:hypothetical protein
MRGRSSVPIDWFHETFWSGALDGADHTIPNIADAVVMTVAIQVPTYGNATYGKSIR